MDPEDIIEAQKGEKKQHESIVICGADVCSMFPSLDAKHTAELVKEAAMESEIKFDGIDYKEVATYLAINLRSWEARKDGLYKLLPRRIYRTGQKPTIKEKVQQAQNLVMMIIGGTQERSTQRGRKEFFSLKL